MRQQVCQIVDSQIIYKVIFILDHLAENISPDPKQQRAIVFILAFISKPLLSPIILRQDAGSTTRAGQSAEEGGQITWIPNRIFQPILISTIKVVDAIKDLVQDCNFDCNDSGIALQAMDNSHVALVSMMLKSESFSPFRCDRNIALGINLTSLQKVLRAANNDDVLTLKAEDAPDVVNMVFENSETDRISEYDLKLMDIDQEHLGIPETEYAATVTMPCAEFQRICRDLSAISESGKSSFFSPSW